MSIFMERKKLVSHLFWQEKCVLQSSESISHGSYVTKKENGKAPHYKSFCECIVFVNYSTKTNKYVSTVIEIEEMADPTWAECL